MSRCLVTAVLLAATAAAQAPVVTTVLSNGTTQSRYDMVILGDGYQAFEQTKFDTDCQTFLTHLFQQQPYATFANYFNVHTVFRASNQSGADQPDLDPPVYVDTVYNASYNTGGTPRCLYIGNTSLALADAALAPATEGRVLVMVNSTRYGGCASTFAVSYTGSQMALVQTHELGHSLGGLADEYDYPNDTYTGAEPSQVNVTTSPIGAKWSIWHGTDGISAFEGARYYAHGLYRPKSSCMMRSNGPPLCAVCREQVSKVTNSFVDTIVATNPATTSVAVSGLQTFSITHIVPAANSPLITWKLDGAVIAGATGTSHVLDGGPLSPGAHTLTVEVLDRTSYVRTDPSLLMLESHTWNLTVTAPPRAQLTVPTFTADLIWVQPGVTMTLSPTVQNVGTATAGPFAVEYFVSDSATTWSASGIYLGKKQIIGLNVGQSLVATHAVQLPWSLPVGVRFVHAVVDRTGTVPEDDENDNSRSVGMVVANAPCGPHLEFDDALLYPRDQGTVSLSAGGTLHPTVVAPCADPAATLYLILWGGSGTAPGVPLSPTAHLPLNPDGFTDLGVAVLNGPELGGFLGVLDAQGVGRATFSLPPSTALPSTTTHFAAVLVTSTELFAAATGAIAVQLAP